LRPPESNGTEVASSARVHREIVTLAFVLHARSYGESDRIVTLLTEEHGKVSGIAKGAKNSRHRFGGTLEPFLLIRAVFRQRSASDLVFLLRCELVRALRTFTRDLDRFAAGSYLLELVDRMVLGRESGRDVYRLVHDGLSLLDDGASCDPLLRAFELHLLAASGYAPALDRCVACGLTADGSRALYLSAERGGLVCRPCVRAGETLRPVAPRTASALAALAARPLAEATTATEDSGALREAAAAAEHLLAAVTTGPVRSRDFMTRSRIDSPSTVR
jgi:DNA repair protein RecO (recombination protein O)